MSPEHRQASADLCESAMRASPPRFEHFSPATTFTNISSIPLPAITHSQSSSPSPNSLTALLGSSAPISANMASTPRHKRAASDLGPISFTPRTGRPSKGLKGKKVHECRFPGCGKLFTRAEHVRSEKLAARLANSRTGVPMQSSPVSLASEPHDLMSPVSLNHPHPSVPTVSHEGNLMSIGSVVQPGSQHHFVNDYSMPIWCEPERNLVRGDAFSESPQVNTDDTLYSSPDSCQSPASDVHPFQFPHPTPIMDQSYSESFYHPQMHESPLILPSTAPHWSQFSTETSTSQVMPISVEGDMLQTVGISVPLPLSGLDGTEWYAMRRELSSAAGVFSGNGGMEVIDIAQWQDCLECYWKHFDPLFPIVHRPTFAAIKPIPLLSGAMVAIGSQYDTRPNSKEYSLSLLEACLNLLGKESPITIRSRISDIQALFLLEYLSKYRSRKADVALSPGFKSLYGTFIQNRHWASKNPLALLNTLSEDDKRQDLGRAYSFWVENETRRRVLQAAFLLDVQQSTMFQLPLAFIQANLRAPRSNVRNIEPIDFPFPCQTALWQSQGAENWAQCAKASTPLTLSSAAEQIIRQNDNTLKLDPFQLNLILSYALLTNMRSMDLEQTLEPFMERVKQGTIETETMQCTEPRSPLTYRSHTLFAYHALLAAYRTPLKALLIVSGESWLFNRKLEEQAEYEKAQKTFLMWVSDTDEIKKAVWHAVRVLEHAIDHPELGDSPVQINSNSDLNHRLGTFGDGRDCVTQSGIPGHYNDGISGGDNPLHMPEGLLERSTILPQPRRAEPIIALNTNWAVYICTLICWAYGADTLAATTTTTTPTPTTTDNLLLFFAPASAREYVSAFTLLSPTWSHISRNSIPEHIRCNTGGLLEYTRTKWLRPDRIGGLLNEGARVLQRLASERHHKNGTEAKKLWAF
ncbi:hypothetical protein AJ78_07524 [Emergomyces pasteurianus Ep9510]|uniref:Xylanolytic transcriptional activator regulatory domain-containing protein n=1 Tax=Emergomyces pasteurianus Ep9510 TaxID=1447872 RepID=A0A1J9Q763_9EURO|nr:hypothetical protein AJ78_07524 [Emergomyces pasteurianus Ep9510]